MSIRSVSAYSLVQATVRALHSMMLTPETWATLLQADDYDTVLTTLSKTVYGPYLRLERQALTPRRAVFQIRGHLVAVYERLIALTPEPGRQLLHQLWRIYEVDNLKATLRGVENGASWDRVRFLLAPMIRMAVLTTADMEAMIRSGNMARAIERTRHTPYYDSLSHAFERYQKEQNLFPLEVALDLDYRRSLWHAMDELQGPDREQARRLAGTVLDADNLLWAIRYRVYHHLSEQEIINYTLPFGYQVHDNDIRAIARGADIAEVVDRIYKGDDHPAELSFEDPRAGLQALEHALAQLVVKRCHATFLGDPFHIGLPIAYLLQNEQEIRNLISVIEAKASRLSRDSLEALVVL
jgi:V/A-type H+/Na+-transporting ATPase subunit C